MELTEYKICAKAFLEGTFMFAPSFLVCAGLTACVRAASQQPILFLFIGFLVIASNPLQPRGTVPLLAMPGIQPLVGYICQRLPANSHSLEGTLTAAISSVNELIIAVSP